MAQQNSKAGKRLNRTTKRATRFMPVVIVIPRKLTALMSVLHGLTANEHAVSPRIDFDRLNSFFHASVHGIKIKAKMPQTDRPARFYYLSFSSLRFLRQPSAPHRSSSCLLQQNRADYSAERDRRRLLHRYPGLRPIYHHA